MSPPPPSNAILQYRIDAGNVLKNGGQRGSLTRCVQQFGAYRDQLLKPEVAADVDADAADTGTTSDVNGNDNNAKIAKKALLHELKLYQLDVSKQFLKLRSSAAKHKIQKQPNEELQKETDLAQQESNKAHEQKACRLEYDALSKVALSINSNGTGKKRSILDANNLELEWEELQKEYGAVEHTLQQREKQFQLLIQYMMDLKESIGGTDKKQKTDDLYDDLQTA